MDLFTESDSKIMFFTSPLVVMLNSLITICPLLNVYGPKQNSLTNPMVAAKLTLVMPRIPIDFDISDPTRLVLPLLLSSVVIVILES